MNAPQHFHANSVDYDVSLSQAEVERRIKLFNPDGTFERQLKAAWDVAGDIILQVARELWEDFQRHPRNNADKSDKTFALRMRELEIQKSTTPTIGRASCRERG